MSPWADPELYEYQPKGKGSLMVNPGQALTAPHQMPKSAHHRKNLSARPVATLDLI